MKSRYLIHKGLHLQHQAANTRARSLLDQNECKIWHYAAKYRDARSALLRTHGSVLAFNWEELKPEDIQCMEDPEALEKRANKEVECEALRARQGGANTAGKKTTPGEGKCRLSWIWLAAASSGSEVEMHESELLFFFDTLVNIFFFF